MQGPLGAAIVDEVDHVLIDQALTPLIVAGDSHVNMRAFERVRDAVSGLVLRQSAAVRELSRRIDRGDGDRQSQDALLAELYLADPQHARLASHFAADPGSRRRVRGLVDSAQTCDPDRRLDSGLLYTVDAEGRSVTLTDRGQRCLERALGPIFDCVEVDRHLAAVQSDDRLPLGERLRRRDRLIKQAYRGYGRLNQVQQMLRAYALLKRDVDYVVVDGEIVLIDELTGRTLPENRYQHGLHAALEAKEGVEVRPESEVLAQISVPGMAARYSQVSGMTGTAVDSGDELRRQYGLRVVRIDPHRGSRRTDYGHRVYETRGDKLAAILDEVRRCRVVGRPVLGGNADHRTVRRDQPCADRGACPAQSPERGQRRRGGEDSQGRGRPRRGHHRDQHGGARHRHTAGRRPGLARRGRLSGPCQEFADGGGRSCRVEMRLQRRSRVYRG